MRRSKTPNSYYANKLREERKAARRRALSVGDLTFSSEKDHFQRGRDYSGNGTLDFRSMMNLHTTNDWYSTHELGYATSRRTGTRNQANYQQHRNSPVKRKIMGKSGNHTLSGLPTLMIAQSTAYNENEQRSTLPYTDGRHTSCGYMSLPSLLHDSAPSGSEDNPKQVNWKILFFFF